MYKFVFVAPGQKSVYRSVEAEKFKQAICLARQWVAAKPKRACHVGLPLNKDQSIITMVDVFSVWRKPILGVLAYRVNGHHDLHIVKVQQ